MTIIVEDTIQEDKKVQKKKLLAKILMQGIDKVKIDEFPDQDRAVAGLYLFNYEDKKEIFKALQHAKNGAEAAKIFARYW